jgi:hypothetical protein
MNDKKGEAMPLPFYFVFVDQLQQQQRTIRAMMMIQQQLLSPNTLPRQLFIVRSSL